MSVSVHAIENQSALVQVMAWFQTGNKPFPELMTVQFSVVYIGHLGLNELKHWPLDLKMKFCQ